MLDGTILKSECQLKDINETEN